MLWGPGDLGWIPTLCPVLWRNSVVVGKMQAMILQRTLGSWDGQSGSRSPHRQPAGPPLTGGKMASPEQHKLEHSWLSWHYTNQEVPILPSVPQSDAAVRMAASKCGTVGLLDSLLAALLYP